MVVIFHFKKTLCTIISDIDECLADLSPCTGEHIECHNLPLSFQYICKKGYIMEGDQCVGEYVLVAVMNLVCINRKYNGKLATCPCSLSHLR